MKARIASALLCLLAIEASAQQKPIRPPAASSEEPRYIGADFPLWPVTQALSTATEAIRHSGSGEPICVEWDGVVSVASDQVTCWCWSQKVNGVVVAAPSGDGGCLVTDDRGPDGEASCVVTLANQARWISPSYLTVRERPGSWNADGICSVASSTTANWGRTTYHPCQATSDCTTTSSGTCSSLASYTAARAREVRYSTSCAFLLARPASAATGYVGGVR